MSTSARDVLHPGGSAIGLWCTIPSPLVAELLARSGPDYVVVDQQHGAVAPGDLLAMTQAIHGAGRTALVRVGSHDPWVIGHALDLGADGVIVPLVDSAAEAAAIVSACRYQPAGRRSWGRVRGEADEDPLVLAMIETRAGLEAVDEIVATDGLDGVYIGPSDLSLGLGAHPTPTIEHAAVLDAIATIRTAAEGAGVLCGLHCLSGEDAARFVPEGFPMVTAGADSGLLRAALASALATARGRG
jgi:4-hydroxy-2-oxoheptanedioate aldolase